MADGAIVKGSGAKAKGSASGGSTYPAPATRDVLIDESFMDNALGSPFVSSVSGTGAAIQLQTGNANPNMAGVVRLITGTTTTGRAAIAAGVSAAYYQPPGSVWTYRSRFQIPTLATMADDFATRLGLGDTLTGAHTDGVYFEHPTFSTANWQCVCAAAGVRTTVDSGIALVAGVVLDSKIVVTVSADGLSAVAQFYLNAIPANGGGVVAPVLVATISTNIPLIAANAFGALDSAIKAAGTTSREVWIDNYELDVAGRGGAN